MDVASRTPEVSVVMSVFNGGSHVERALSCILEQTLADFEFIVIDDGSTDETAAILAAAAATDPRIRIVSRQNAGLTRALIHGCSLARGKYIARQDVDDVSLPTRLEEQRKLLDSDPALAMASCWTELIGPGDELLLVQKRPADPDSATASLLARKLSPEHGSVMFRRASYEQVGGYREVFYFAQDGDLWLRLAAIGRIAYVQEVLYRYRVSAASMSGHLHPAKIPFAELITRLHEARNRGVSEEPIIASANLSPRMSPTQRSSADSTHYFIARCLFARRDPRSLRYVRYALADNPRNLRAWLLLGPAAVLSLLGRVPETE